MTKKKDNESYDDKISYKGIEQKYKNLPRFFYTLSKMIIITLLFSIFGITGGEVVINNFFIAPKLTNTKEYHNKTIPELTIPELKEIIKKEEAEIAILENEIQRKQLKILELEKKIEELNK